MVGGWQHDCSKNPSYPDWDFEYHEQSYKSSFSVIILDISWFDSQACDKDDEEDNIEKREEMIHGVEGTGINSWDPLENNDKLN